LLDHFTSSSRKTIDATQLELCFTTSLGAGYEYS
jgi:hypothetical protein